MKRVLQTLPAVRVSTWDEIVGGSFLFESDWRGLFYGCPCGCGRRAFLPFEGMRLGVGWHWNGDLDKPTLSPKIVSRRERGGCGWSGYLVAGHWRTA